MIHQKKDSIWITIPDENSSELKKAPASSLPKDLDDLAEIEPIQNKFFWSTALVALFVFMILLFFPHQFSSLLKGNLFDGNFQVVPNYEDQDFTSKEEEKDLKSLNDSDNEDETVVEANDEAIDVQVEPIVSENSSSADTSQTTSENDTSTENNSSIETVSSNSSNDDSKSETVFDDKNNQHPSADSVELNSDESEKIDLKNSDQVVLSDEKEISEDEINSDNQSKTSDFNSDVLQAMSQEIESFKEKESRNEVLIQELIQALEDQKQLHSAPLEAQTNNIASSSVGTGNSVGTVGGYRYNTHLTSVSPFDVLSKNKGMVQKQASYQANVLAYSNQVYNPALSAVKGQPSTGPKETFLFAMLLASFGILFWGIVRTVRI